MTTEPAAVCLSRSEAILAVADVTATVRFYRDKLGFTGEWLWGDPPSFAGVTWGKVSVLFGLQPDLAARVEGHQHAFTGRGRAVQHGASGAEREIALVSDIDL